METLDEYCLLKRCLSEQTIVEGGTRRLREKKKDSFPKAMMQSPTDPDATYREKVGKKYRGYVANVEEAVDSSGSVIVDYQLEQNIYSDSEFLQDRLERMEPQEKGTLYVTDGAYCGEHNTNAAKEKNIQLITTALTGTEVPDIYADFEFSEDGSKILRCPMGNVPQSCCQSSSNGHFYVSFPKDVCMNCPHKEECRAKEHKKSMFLYDIAYRRIPCEGQTVYENRRIRSALLYPRRNRDSTLCFEEKISC